MASASLLPSSVQDARTMALASLIDRLDGLDLGLLRQLWDPDRCDAKALPYLAKTFGVLDDAWALAKTEVDQRALVKLGLILNRHRGTPWALKQVLGTVGWPLAIVEEGIDKAKHDKSIRHDGEHLYGGPGTWAIFRVRFDLANRPLTAANAAMIIRTVTAWSPAARRCGDLAFHLALSGGWVSGKSPLDARFMSVCGESFPLVVETDRVAARIGAARLTGKDLRTFTLLDGSGTQIASATRNVVLEKAGYVLRIEWSLS